MVGDENPFPKRSPQNPCAFLPHCNQEFSAHALFEKNPLNQYLPLGEMDVLSERILRGRRAKEAVAKTMVHLARLF